MTDEQSVASLSIDALIAFLADAAANKRLAELVQVGVELGRRLERADLGDAPTWHQPLRVSPAMVEAAVHQMAPPPSATRTSRRTRPLRCPVCDTTDFDNDGHLIHRAGCTSSLVDGPRPDLGIRPRSS